MEINELRSRLSAFVDDTFDSSLTLGQVEESDGHAGLTYLFDVRNKNSQAVEQQYVIKIPPPGVKLKGNTDVMRQAPLLNALHEQGLPVPRVPYAYATSSWFERPFIVMERLPGRVFFVWEPHRSFPRTGPEATRIWTQCIEQLAPLHRFEWQRYLRDWETSEALGANLLRWRKIYQHALDTSWSTAAERIEKRLLDHLPTDYRVGLFHGDFQPGNMLYEDNTFTAIIDWELAGISAQLLDLGWLLMVCDRSNWIDDYHPIAPPHQSEVLAIYESAFGGAQADVPWFQAFAGFRLASIACLNHKLHVSGKRPEPAWENIGRCVMPMFKRAERLLAHYG